MNGPFREEDLYNKALHIASLIYEQFPKGPDLILTSSSTSGLDGDAFGNIMAMLLEIGKGKKALVTRFSLTGAQICTLRLLLSSATYTGNAHNISLQKLRCATPMSVTNGATQDNHKSEFRCSGSQIRNKSVSKRRGVGWYERAHVTLSARSLQIMGITSTKHSRRAARFRPYVLQVTLGSL